MYGWGDIMRTFALSVLVLGLCGTLLPGQGRQNKAGFVAVVESRFGNWDTNRNGSLESSEIDHLLNSHSVRGDEAAAVASIHVWFRGNPSVQHVTLQTLKNMKDGTEERRDLSQKSPHLNSNYLAFSKHLREVPRQVFARNPSVVGMSQGHLGDCFFVSTMGGFVHRNPAEIRKIIHQNPDGSFDVSFNPNHKVHVPALTDGLICLGSTAHDQGLWLNIMEEGAGQAHHAKKGSTNTNEPAVDRLAKGGDMGEIMELLTGHAVERMHFKHVPHAKIHDAMTRAKGSGLLVGAATPGAGAHLPPGVPSGHAYSVLEVKGNNVTLWNPWGNHFKPKQMPYGKANGYAVENGIFTMPFNDFAETYESVVIETHQMAKRR